MGVTVSTSLAKIKENPLLLRFVGGEAIPEGDAFWKELLSFAYSPPKNQLEARLLDEAVSSLVDTLIKHNHSTGHLRTLVRLLLEMTARLRDESKCESNLATLHVHNALLMVRVCLKQLLLNHSEEELIVQLDGAATIPQITSLEVSKERSSPQPVSSTSGGDPLISLAQAAPGSGSTWNKDRSPTTGERSAAGGQRSDLPPGSSLPASMNAAEVIATETLLSRQLVEGLVSLLVEVPLLPFTYDIHCEAMSLLLVLLSSQMYGLSSGSGILLQHIISIPPDLSNLLVHCLVHHFISQPSPPPDHLRSHSSGFISSITSGIWSLVVPSASSSDKRSPLADQSVLLLLVLTHQQMHGHNPFRQALFSFTDDHGGDRSRSSFSVSLEKLYISLCSHLTEQTTLFLYLLLQGNHSVASFIFSRSDINLLVLPLLQQLHDCAQQSSHHVYMLLIIILILSQDDCFNKSIHEVNLPRVLWYKERSLTNLSLGSLMVIVLVRTIQVNISQIRDKYLHTNCLAALANMSAHFHSLHLDAAQKLVNLFKLLAKKHQKISEKIRTSPSSLTEEQSREQPDYATDQSIVEEILLMILEIMNSCLTHRLHHNPHLVYSLLYQREVFDPFKTSPSLMDLIGNIDNVVEFFSKKLEESGPSPYSSDFVLDTIIKASQVWPRHRLRVFPDLKFRYVEEDQPEEFFVPYVWTIVFKSSPLHWDHSKIHFTAT